MNQVLILTEDVDQAKTLITGLGAMHQFRVRLATRGEEALGLFDKDEISVVATDIILPDMDALDVLSCMTQRQPNTPCIVMTDHGKPWFNKKMAYQSFVYHIEKPLKIETLTSAIFVGLNLKGKGENIQGVSIASVLPLIEMLQKTCRMEAVSKENSKGYLYFNKGVLFDAHLADLRGELAARKITEWKHITFKIGELPRRRFRTRVRTNLMDIAGASWDKPQSPEKHSDDVIHLSRKTKIKISTPSTSPKTVATAVDKQYEEIIRLTPETKKSQHIAPAFDSDIYSSDEKFKDDFFPEFRDNSIGNEKNYPIIKKQKPFNHFNADDRFNSVMDMYLEYYQLAQKPFQINTDPSFLWYGEKHKEALATLKYGIQENKSFILLTGDVGVGKTTIVNALIQSLGHNEMAVVVHNPVLDRLDFFNYVARSFGLSNNFKTKGDFLEAFRDFLLKSYYLGKRVLLIIDECQLLSPSLLAEIRLFLNFEKKGYTLINIFLVGQLEFNDIILRPENRPIRQRISVNYRIRPLNLRESAKYVEYRLAVAGANRKIFKASAIKEIFRFSKGYPRLINILADHALLTGYTNSDKYIKKRIIRECAKELNISPSNKADLQKNKINETGQNPFKHPVLTNTNSFRTG